MTFARTLIDWYAVHKRNLPWRETNDAYRIWVSEIILQQTRVNQGLDYYHRFLQAFPSVDALANSEADELLKVWQGLGYYSRARNMQAAAQQIMELGGKMPTQYADLIKLKGIGPYTAAAISSFAFGLPHAVVDGNVYRVLSRYFGIAIPINQTEGKKYFEEMAQTLLPSHDVAAYNQAIMDFGALQCKPQSPNCEVCPLVESCVAYHDGLVSQLPKKVEANPLRSRYFTFFLILTPSGLLIRQRPKGDIWTWLYDFPAVETPEPPKDADVWLSDVVKQLPKDGTWTLCAKHVKHVLTHQRIWADAYLFRTNQEVELSDAYFPVPIEQLQDYPMPKLMLILLNKLDEIIDKDSLKTK